MKLSNRVYNVIKFIVTILLPGAGTLYFAIAQIWGLPYAENVIGTVNAVALFLGVLIGHSTHQYNKNTDGDLIISEVDGEKYPVLAVERSMDHLASKERVKLNVINRPVPEANAMPTTDSSRPPEL